MPFTLAHVAVVLPFRRRWRAGFIALALGSMGPDLPYFLPSAAGIPEFPTHTWAGALTAGAALALLLLVIVVLLRPVLTAPLWGRHRTFLATELEPYAHASALWLLAVPAVIVGSAIHYMTDAATHRNGWFVNHLPALNADLPPVFGHEVTVFHSIQYTGSVLGLALLAWWYRRELRQIPDPPPGTATGRPRTVQLLAAVATTIGAYSSAVAAPSFGSLHGRTYIALTSGISAFLVLYVLLGLVLLLVRERR